MMVACSPIYIYLQPVQENESENGTGNRNLWGQRLDELIREDCVVEITDGAIKEEVVKISHLIMGEVTLMSHLANAKIWKVNTRPDLYNAKRKEPNEDMALALLESGIIEPIDVLAKAKGVVGASFFTRFALLAQALGFLFSIFVRWHENASISPLELIASYYALVLLRRSGAHLVGIDRIRFPSSFGHNRNEGVCTKYTENRKCKWTETRDITWKTHNGGKNHDSRHAVEYTI